MEPAGKGDLEGTAREAGGKQGKCNVTESRSTKIRTGKHPQSLGPGSRSLAALVRAFAGEGYGFGVG